MDPNSVKPLKPGDVVQINEKHGRTGWIGALVMVSEVKVSGIHGFVAVIKTPNRQSRAYIRLEWDEIDFIGTALLMPGEEVESAS